MAKRMTGKQFNERIEQLGYTQVGFAEKIGVNPRTVRHWIAGSYPVPIVVAVLVALMTKYDIRPNENGRLTRG